MCDGWNSVPHSKPSELWKLAARRSNYHMQHTCIRLVYTLCLCVIDYIMFVNEGPFLNKIYVYTCICKT